MWPAIARPEGVGDHRGRPHGLQLARRAGQDDDGGRRRAVGGRHDEAGRGPDGLEDRRADGDRRLLAVALLERREVDVRPALGDALEDLGDAPAQGVVHRHRAALEAPDDLGGQVVRGRPEAAAGDDQVAALGGQEGERVLHVLRAVADDDDRLQVDAELAQAVREPRPVAVHDAAGEDLGAGDDDARSRAHQQPGPWAAGTRRVRGRGDLVGDRVRGGGHVARLPVDDQPRAAVAEHQAHALGGVRLGRRPGLEDDALDQDRAAGAQAGVDGAGRDDLQAHGGRRLRRGLGRRSSSSPRSWSCVRVGVDEAAWSSCCRCRR